MTTSKLSRVLAIFEGSREAFSFKDISRELNISQSQVEALLEYWIHRGKIRSTNDLTECNSCSATGQCPFIAEMPRTYELVNEPGEMGALLKPSCK